MSIKIPAATNVDGGEGGNTDLYFRCVSLYTDAKYGDNLFMNEDSYYTKVYCGNMQCNPTSGAPYKKYNLTYYPYLMYAGGNSCTYQYYAYAKDDFEFPEGYIGWAPSMQNYQTVQSGTFPMSVRLEMKATALLKYTVPKDTKLGLYFQNANFNTKPIKGADGYPVTNADGTKTYGFKLDPKPQSKMDYTWRLTDTTGEHVTVAGDGYPNSDLTGIYNENGETDKHYHGFDKINMLGTRNDEADVYTGADPTGAVFIGSGDTKRIRSYRMWEIITNLTANIMMEPDFNYEIIGGKTNKFDKVSGGNARDNWADIDPDGTAICAVTYDSLQVADRVYGGLYPATAPERASVFIVSDDTKGKAKAKLPKNGFATDDKNRTIDWDYNYDTWHYNKQEKDPSINFTAENANKVEYAIVTTDNDLHSTLSGWKEVSADGGKYVVSLEGFREAKAKGGTVIIRMTDEDGNISYQNVKVSEFSVTGIENLTNPGEKIMPGNKVKLTFSGLYRGIQKMSGIFNPQTAELRYENGDTLYKGPAWTYCRMNSAELEVAIPEDMTIPENQETKDYVLSNGRIFGRMYSDAKAFNGIYTMTDNGVGVNFNAITTNYVTGNCADISIPVHHKAKLNTTLKVLCGDEEVNNYTVKLKNSNGEVIDPDGNGVFPLTYNEYSYEITGPTIVRKLGKFRLGSSTPNEDGAVTQTISVEAAHMDKSPWDGTAVTEPEKDGNNVYQIGKASELAWLAKTVNEGNGNVDAVLTDDIELAGYEWTPIGTKTKKYSGKFDGRNHKIYNMAINFSGKNPCLGLFGTTDAAQVRNIELYGEINCASSAVVVTADSGSVFAYLGKHSLAENIISHVNFSVTPTGKPISSNYWYNIGGIAGSAFAATLKDCINYGKISGKCNVGGIVGETRQAWNPFSSEPPVRTIVKNCNNYGSISGKSETGGIVGSSLAGCPVEFCNNYGSVSAESKVGGIAGICAKGIIKGCSNEGFAGGSKENIGGIVGYARIKGGEISKCFNKGKVTGGEAATAVGAVIGRIEDVAASDLLYLKGTAEKGIGEAKNGQTAMEVTLKTQEEIEQEKALIPIKDEAKKSVMEYLYKNISLIDKRTGIEKALEAIESIDGAKTKDEVEELRDEAKKAVDQLITEGFKAKRPSGFKVSTNAAKKKIVIRWRKVVGATSYQVAFKRNSAKKWTVKTLKSSASKYTLKANANAGYQIRVRAVRNVSGNKAYSKYTAVSKRLVNKGKLLRIKAGKKLIRTSWKKASGVTGYQISYGRSKKASDKIVRIKGAKKSSYTVRKLKRKKTYYVKVRAYKTSKGVTFYGNWSKLRKIRVK